MKRLYLIRHAKTEPARSAATDHERSLVARGLSDAVLVAQAIAQDLCLGGYRTDAILVSSARRTQETLTLMRPYIDPAEAASLRTMAELYLASADTLLRVVRGLDTSVATACVIGHNDGLHVFAQRLAGQNGSADLRARLAEKFPTGAAIRIDFPHDDWRRIGWGQGHPAWLVHPRDLRPEDAEPTS